LEARVNEAEKKVQELSLKLENVSYLYGWSFFFNEGLICYGYVSLPYPIFHFLEIQFVISLRHYKKPFLACAC
jgi:hypothetical protein